MWKDLSMKDKAKFIKVAINNDITDLASIEKAYNSFAEGGNVNQDYDVPYNIPISDINTPDNNPQKGVTFGKFANSYLGHRVLPYVHTWRKMRGWEKGEVTPREFASFCALIGDGLSLIPGGQTVGAGLQLGGYRI